MFVYLNLCVDLIPQIQSGLEQKQEIKTGSSMSE